MSMANADKIQDVINGDLFPQKDNVAGVKQVLEFMNGVAQPLREEQLRALLLLQTMGENERLHGKKNPYKSVIEKLGGEYKKAVAPTEVYLRTIEELIPKPPKPIIMAEKVEKGGK